jgi:hypothetical protein
MPIFVPVCKKHFVQLMTLKIIFWILLIGIFIGADFGVLIHSIILFIFPLVAFYYFSAKSNVSIYNIKGSATLPEVILSVRRENYYKRLSELEGVQPIPFPEPPIYQTIKRCLLMALLFFPWIYFAKYLS